MQAGAFAPKFLCCHKANWKDKTTEALRNAASPVFQRKVAPHIWRGCLSHLSQEAAPPAALLFLVQRGHRIHRQNHRHLQPEDRILSGSGRNAAGRWWSSRTLPRPRSGSAHLLAN